MLTMGQSRLLTYAMGHCLTWLSGADKRLLEVQRMGRFLSSPWGWCLVPCKWLLSRLQLARPFLHCWEVASGQVTLGLEAWPSHSELTSLAFSGKDTGHTGGPGMPGPLTLLLLGYWSLLSALTPRADHCPLPCQQVCGWFSLGHWGGASWIHRQIPWSSPQPCRGLLPHSAPVRPEHSARSTTSQTWASSS